MQGSSGTRYAVCIVGILLMSMPLFARAVEDLDIRESMTAREYWYGQTPALHLTFTPAPEFAGVVHLSARVVREDAVQLGTFADDVPVLAGSSTSRVYPIMIPEWKAGYYYVSISMNYNEGGVIVARHVVSTFTLRPHMSPYVIYGSTALGFLVGVGLMVIYWRRKSA